MNIKVIIIGRRKNNFEFFQKVLINLVIQNMLKIISTYQRKYV